MGEARAGYVVVWEFRVAAEHVGEFEQVYAADGAWARLFARHPGWISTELLRDAADSGRFLTLDRWTERAALDDFRARFAAEYAALDARCEALTLEERRIGEYAVPA